MVLVLAKADRVELRAPYHPTLPHRCRALGGRWQGAETGWVFAPDQEEALRAVCLDVFGLDGREEAPRDMVELRVVVDERAVIRTVFKAFGRPIFLLGRQIAAAVPNRKTARPGRGIRFIRGRPICRPSVDIWQVSVPNGSVFVMCDVPRVTVARLIATIGDAGSAELVEAR